VLEKARFEGQLQLDSFFRGDSQLNTEEALICFSVTLQLLDETATDIEYSIGIAAKMGYIRSEKF